MFLAPCPIPRCLFATNIALVGTARNGHDGRLVTKEMVLVDSVTSPKPPHIVWKQRASRVRWRAAYVRAEDREGARGRDRWGALCGSLPFSLPVYPVDRPHSSSRSTVVDSLLYSLPSTAVYP